MPHVDAHLRPIRLVRVRGGGIALGEGDEVDGVLDEVLHPVAVPPVERVSAAVLHHAAQAAVDDGNGFCAELLAEEEVLIKAQPVFHLIVYAARPDVGVIGARRLLAVGGDLLRPAVIVQRIGEGGNGVPVLRGDRADGVLPIVVFVARARFPLDDAPAREAEELGRERLDRLIEIALDARLLVHVLRFQHDIVEISGARRGELHFKIQIFGRRFRRRERRAVFHPARAARFDLPRGVDLRPVRDGERDLPRVVLDERREGVIYPLLHRHPHDGVPAVFERGVRLRRPETQVIFIDEGAVRVLECVIPRENTPPLLAGELRAVCAPTVQFSVRKGLTVLKRAVDEQVVVEREGRVVDVLQKEPEQIGRDAVRLRLLVDGAAQGERRRRVRKDGRFDVWRFGRKAARHERSPHQRGGGNGSQSLFHCNSPHPIFCRMNVL